MPLTFAAMTIDQQHAAHSALADFVGTINATGGVMQTHEGLYAPVGDEDWMDLGDAYLKACHAIGLLPKIARR